MMASSSNLLGKRKPEDDLETKPVLRKHKANETTKGFADCLQQTKSDEAKLVPVKDTEEGLDDLVEETAVRKKTLFAGYFINRIQISDIINFFKDAGAVVRVRFIPSGKAGEHVGYGFIEFASANEANKALQKKNGEYLLDQKLFLMKLHDDEIEEAAVPEKTLFVGHFPRRTEISDIINFFKDVGEVVHVRLIADYSGDHVGYGFVEFASANEAMKALQNKKGEYLLNSKIFLGVANKGATYQPPKFCIDHTVWYKEDHLQPVEEDETHHGFVKEVLLVANLSPYTTKIVQILDFFEDVGEVVGVRLILNHKHKNTGYCFVEFASAYQAKKALEEKNGAYLHDRPILLMKGHDRTPDFDEEVVVRRKTLFIAGLSRQTEISDIINFFQDVGGVVHVRLIATHKSKAVGHGFVEFASANEAMTALQEKNGKYMNNRKISLDVFAESKIAPNLHLPRRHKYCIDHKVWYEDHLRQETLVSAVDETPEDVDIRERTFFFVYQACKTSRLGDIIEVFRHVGDVVRIRLIVDHRGQRLGCGFVEFASANEAKNALKKNRKITGVLAKIDPYPFRPKYNLAEKLWYEDNLRRESLDLKSKYLPPLMEKESKLGCREKTIFLAKKRKMTIFLYDD